MVACIRNKINVVQSYCRHNIMHLVFFTQDVFERSLKVSPFTVLLLIGYFVYIQYNIIVVTSINVHLQQYNTSTLSIDLQFKN